MSQWELAQLNVATMLAPIDSPELSEFVSALDRINAIADSSPGFIWRLQSDDGNATDVEHAFGSNMLVNMSVWDSVEALHAYVYRTAHAEFMSRRKEWFQRMTDAYTVLWWVPQGHRPSTYEAQVKLDLLKASGPCPEAFTFKSVFGMPSECTSTEPRQFDDKCPAT